MATRALFRASIGLLLAGCSAASAPADAGRWYASSERPLENRAGVFYYEGQPFSGRLYELSGSDTVFTAGYRNGREQGEWRRFYAGGRLAESRFYSDGVKTGTLRGWWDNGTPRLEYRFVANEYEGLCREWNRNGTLLAERRYHAGYEEGQQTIWYDNGRVKSNYVMRNGRRYGLLGTKNCVNVSDSLFRK